MVKKPDNQAANHIEGSRSFADSKKIKIKGPFFRNRC